jgi:superfamily II DNA/RNA helicase
MDVFSLREKVVNDYRDYIKSFVRIRDERIDQFVQQKFSEGALWPDAILQLNPAYQPGATLDQLAAQGVILRATADFFRSHDGKYLTLYKHQEKAIEIARRWEPYVVTTGTGSGKSLTYLVPIVDHVLRTNPQNHRVRAIIVYPMNALINSQENALKQFAAANPGIPIRFARYTGQEKEDARDRIQNDPPHILLTNYVMLEYMMLRPAERHFTDRATAGLEFLVLDELHTYRGRQGADIAMLMRRLRERTHNPGLLNIGTSATLASGGNRDDRRRAAAQVATKIFGLEVKPENVVDETLQRAIVAVPPRAQGELAEQIEGPLPQEATPVFIQYPLAAWVENTFGLDEEDGRLVRRKPVKFQDGVKKLSAESSLPEEKCAVRLRQVLEMGNRLPGFGQPLFPFRLHQFLAAGGTVYATLEPSRIRYRTLEAQHYSPSDNGEKLLYPLVFCRDCGQEYYMVSWRDGEAGYIFPRLPFLTSSEDESESSTAGYVALNEAEGPIWSREHEDDLPDYWYEPSGARIKRDYRRHVPVQFKVGANGKLGEKNGIPVWFEPQPFLLCMRCGAAYDRTERNDFKKLSRLSNTGRSTSTTVLSSSVIVQLRADQNVEAEARKLLSFTDNRQDASLQAGHFNDFVQVALVRSALYLALSERKQLDHGNVTQAVFKTLQLPQSRYAKEPAEWGPGKQRNEDSFQKLLDYRLYEDLRRGWRVAQPNLEQCGLLRIGYKGLPEMCAVDEPWKTHPLLQAASPSQREKVIGIFLDHLRREMAIDARSLEYDEQIEIKRRVQQNLREPWTLDDTDQLLQSSIFLKPGDRPQSRRERSLDPARSKIMKALRRKDLWNLSHDLTPNDAEKLVIAVCDILRGQYLTRARTEDGREGIQLLADSIEWTLGDGTPPPPDPVRFKKMQSPRLEKVEREANRFFATLYRETARGLVGVEGGAHTGQIPAALRQERELRFGKGDLSALFCSPTMELGVDIRDLNVVHLRNVPPTPANYAQRSGRAGRSGQQALVAAFCSEGSQHDQYFFRRPSQMVAGAVAPARLELGNEELVRAHIQSVWLAASGIKLGRGMAEVLELEQSAFPLNADIQHRLTLSPEKTIELREECEGILRACGDDLRKAPWFQNGWLTQVLKDAPLEFNKSFQRWRDLYLSAIRQRDEARRQVDKPSARREERAEAKRRESEAQREIDLLLNRSDEFAEADFYPYRYLASEGFLPGYNFPRLPLRALVPSGGEFHVIDRPRFLGLPEFGPRNIIYHEGRKYRMARCVLPPGGVDSRMNQAKFCYSCGYFHDSDHAGADRCDHCGVPLDGHNSQFVPTLFELTTVRGYRVERITCDEEERVREGFEIDTHYRFRSAPDGTPMLQRAQATSPDGEPLMHLTQASQAQLWRVNQRWRRSEHKGFTLDARNGYWARRPGDEDDKAPEATADLRVGVRPFVRDTRNILLVRPQLAGASPDDSFLYSLAYALQRGMQIMFQVEPQEIAVELIGRGAEQRILFWEASEGGNGIWPRMIEEPDAVAEIAHHALIICHFNPDTGEEIPDDARECSRACYECLLNYSNQVQHSLIDRRGIKDYLLLLSRSRTTPVTSGRSRSEHYAWLAERLDQNSSLEKNFLNLLFESGRKLPDRAQFRPAEGIYAEADFYYQRNGIPGICIFCDGPDHDLPQRKETDAHERANLGDSGFRIVVIRYDRSLADQIAEHPDIFGPGTKTASVP